MSKNIFGRQAAALLSCGLMAACLPMCADEGMWTFDNPPVKQLEEKYHFTPTQQWLDHVRLSSVRLNDGGSGSFVSPHGLLLTNHHVARGQLQKNSTAEHDYVKTGFYAATPDAEMKSPDLEVNVLMSMENVTPRVLAALQGAKTPEQEFTKRKAVIADIERESLEKTGLRSDVVTLYQGGEYWLYRYKKIHRCAAGIRTRGPGGVLRRRSGQFHLSALRPGYGAVPRVRERQAHRDEGLFEVESDGRGRR